MRADVRPNQHDPFLQAERVADFPARAGVGVRAIDDRHQPIGLVDPTDIGREDACRVLAGFLFLRQEHLVAGCPQGGGDSAFQVRSAVVNNGPAK